MKHFKPVLYLSLAIYCAPALADKKPAPPEGTTPEELKQATLPLPAQTKVAILPFADFGDDAKRKHTATASAYLYFGHEGFNMVPLPEAATATANDKETEPGEGLRRSDAARIGKALGANLAVYGEIKGMRAWDKTGWFSEKKNIEMTMRITVVNCDTGAPLYWQTQTATHKAEKQPGMSRPDTRARVAVEMAELAILKPFFDAVPAHETVANIKGEKANHVPDDGNIWALINILWPKEDKATKDTK